MPGHPLTVHHQPLWAAVTTLADLAAGNRLDQPPLDALDELALVHIGHFAYRMQVSTRVKCHQQRRRGVMLLSFFLLLLNLQVVSFWSH